MVEDAVWIDQILRVEYSAAVVALVSSGGDVVAVWTFSFYEPVGQEALVVFAVWQDNVLFEDISVLVEGAIEFLDELLVNRTFCSCVVVELNVELLDAAGEDSMILVG